MINLLVILDKNQIKWEYHNFINLYYSRSRKINKNSNANSKSIFIPTDRSILIKLSISILLILLTSIFAQFRFFEAPFDMNELLNIPLNELVPNISTFNPNP